MTIRTKEDWWRVLNETWPDILQIAQYVNAPLDKLFEEEGPNREPILHLHTLLVELERAKLARNYDRIGLFLQHCWAAAPNSAGTHKWAGWDALCDLCSEGWVFDPEEMSGSG